jgi:general secretion pathway protein N
MGAWLRRNPITALLAVLGVLLAIVLAAEFYAGGPDLRPAGARRAVPAEAKLLPPLAATAPEQAYPEIAARPLFAPTRRPAPPVVAAPQQPTIQRNQFVLMGVIMAGDTRIAMLREKSSGRLVRVERGAEINGMKVATIEREAVTLAAGAENETVTLTVQKPGAPGAAPPSAAAVPQGPFRLPPHVSMPSGAPTPGVVNNPVPPQNAQAPMTPEELLERRRARRAQQTQ